MLLTAIESQSHRAMGSPLETDFTHQLWDQEGLHNIHKALVMNYPPVLKHFTSSIHKIPQITPNGPGMSGECF